MPVFTKKQFCETIIDRYIDKLYPIDNHTDRSIMSYNEKRIALKQQIKNEIYPHIEVSDSVAVAFEYLGWFGNNQDLLDYSHEKDPIFEIHRNEDYSIMSFMTFREFIELLPD